MISKYVSLPIFLISFIIGLFCVYIIEPETKKIYVYPSPQNYMKTQYKDIADECFEFKPIEKTCPINPLSIKTIPIQT
jgi:hypothetical protein